MKASAVSVYSLGSLLLASLVATGCKQNQLNEDAGSTTDTSGSGSVKNSKSGNSKNDLVSGGIALKWNSDANEQMMESGLAVQYGPIQVLPYMNTSNSTVAGWTHCFENNTKSACKTASVAVQNSVGSRPVVIQAFQLNVSKYGSHYPGTIGSPSAGAPIAVNPSWTINLDGAWIKTAVLGFDADSGALKLSSPHLQVIAGASDGSSCQIGSTNAVGGDTGNTKILTGIAFFDEAVPDPTGGTAGSAQLNNYYVRGSLKAGKVWYAGLMPSPQTADPFRLSFVPTAYGDDDGASTFGLNRGQDFSPVTNVNNGILPKFEDTSEDRAKRVITGVCIQGRKTSSDYSRPLFYWGMFRFNKPSMAQAN